MRARLVAISDKHAHASRGGTKNTALTPALRTDIAVQRLLHHFIDTMRRNEAGILADSDSECVHDYRVNVRRSRSLLGQIDQVFPKRLSRSLKSGLKQLGDLTTPLRDLDVMLADFDHLRAPLPAAMQAALEAALQLIQQQRQEAWQRVAQHLQSKRYQKTMGRWLTQLDRPPAPHTRLANATRPLQQVASETIWKRYQRVLKQGRAIDDDSPAEALHTLRKNCKKLRYLIEFFESLYPGGKIKRITRVLKRLQDNLGRYQDIEVQLDFLLGLHDHMQHDAQLGNTAEKAVNCLISRLIVKQRECREEFGGVFDAFDKSRHKKHFKELFKA